ncbi:MAG: GIY-YIG nuclease family protein [Flavobacteriales bacterium]|nr:GIY-YIG nuclease family protein [Flavobacteriales bacterium]
MKKIKITSPDCLQIGIFTKVLFAITDIETTGGQPAGNGITEIAIVLWDGEKVVDRWHSLVNPGQEIPPFISALTGITADMLEDAPTFEEIAEDVHALLDKAVFVAHNVNFDYSFIRSQLQHCGIAWEPKKLCSVRLTRKAFPGLRSYSLSNLCTHFGIQNHAAHRAFGDADATMEIFIKCAAQLGPGALYDMIKRGNPESYLPNHLDAATYLNLPDKPGVYYMLDAKGKPLYVGKARNIRSRVKQHFSADRTAEKLHGFMREVCDIEFTLTGTELIALLVEDAEIRKYWPPYNRAQKNKPALWGVFVYHDQRGYMRFGINPVSKNVAPLRTFHSVFSARNWLLEFAGRWELDLHLSGFVPPGPELPEIDTHNAGMQEAIANVREADPSYLLHGRGRSQDESSFVWIEKGQLRGYGFTSETVSSPDQLLPHLKELPSSPVIQSIVTMVQENAMDMRLVQLSDARVDPQAFNAL